MRKPSWILVVMMASAVVASTGAAFAGDGPNVTLPFEDTFEGYTNRTPLNTGTNGWYGDSASIVVQTNVHYPQDGSSTNAAMIPEGYTLSNRFDNIAVTNVWIQMDVRPIFYDSTNPVVVDTNAAWMFYVKSNGNFVVHNGPPDDPAKSTRWVETTRGGMETNGTNWVNVQIRMNYANHTWGLYNYTTNSSILVTNNIGFVNTNLTNFAGFDVYNGGLSTSYIDNVSVSNMPATNYYLLVTPDIVTNSVMPNCTTNIALTITNQGAGAMYWTARALNPWIQLGSTNGTVAVGGATNLVVTNSAVTLAVGTHTGSVEVSAASADELLSPEISVVTFVLQVMELQITPSATNAVVMQGEWTNNSFEIWNAGSGVLGYTVTTNQHWLVLSQSAGNLTGQTAGATNTIVVTYTNTAGLTVGPNYGRITINATKGGSVTLDVTLNVRAVPMLNVSPTLVTSTVTEGQNPTPQPLLIWNGSADYGIGYRVATNGDVTRLSVQVTNNYLAPLTTNTLTINYAVSDLTSAGDVPSNYFWSITVTATTDTASSLPASGSPVTVPVTVTVNPRPRLVLSLTNLSQTVLQGQQDVGSKWFEIWNSNVFSTLNYRITTTNANNSNERIAWLIPTPASGSSMGEHDRIEVQFSTVNLLPGLTNAVINVIDTGRNETQKITVALSVTPFATLSNNAQSVYAYTVRKGVAPPDTVFLNWNGGNPPNAMDFTVSSSVNWLRPTPTAGTSTGASDKVKVSVQADTTGMKPGVVYRGTVQIDATDKGSGKTAYESPKTFAIAVVIRNFKGFDFQGGLSLSGASDLLLYREADGAWEIRNLMSNYATTQYLGGAGYQAMPGDYTGDGITEMGVYRSASGSWYAQQVGEESARAIEMQQWAGADYVGVPGDYDGDGQTDLGVYLEQSGLWMLLLSSKGYQPDQQVSGIFGGAGYTALQAGDYDGDCIVDPGVYHRASGLWMLLFSISGSIVSGTFGGDGLVPVPTDYDGDGITDPAIYAADTGYWSILPSTTPGLWIRQFGGVALSATLVPAPGNYDGVGGADLGLYDTTTWRWYIITFNLDPTLDGVPLAWGYPMGRLGCLPLRP